MWLGRWVSLVGDVEVGRVVIVVEGRQLDVVPRRHLDDREFESLGENHSRQGGFSGQFRRFGE